MSGGVFGEGGGEQVANRLSAVVGGKVPLLGSIPLDAGLRVSADEGAPLVVSEPENPAAVILREVAARLAVKPRGLLGMSLSVDPVRH
jgi:ATP-binding protein involved in chromosome partitioning